MSSGSTQQSSASPEQVRQQVRQAFDQLRELSRHEIPLEQFCQAMLQRMVPLTGAYGSIVWRFEPETGFRQFSSLGDRCREIPAGHETHRDLMREIAGRGEPMAIQASTIGLSDEDSPGEGNRDILLMIVPIVDRRNRVWGMLELLQRSGISESSRDGYLRFLQQLSGLFSRWHEQQDLRTLNDSQDRWSQRMDLAREVHKARGVRDTAYAVANETRRLLDADRVSVAAWNGRHSRIEAISSQDKFDNRANVVRMLARIADSAIRTDETLWICGDTSNLSPSLANIINEYLEESHSRTLAILPLKTSDPASDSSAVSLERRPKMRQGRPCGALIVEYFDQEMPQSRIHEDLLLSTEHARIGMARSLDEDAVFLMPLWRTLGRLRRLLLGDALRKTIAAAVALTLVTLFLSFWPLELKMRVDGVLQPTVRRNLFTGIDGVIDQVKFDHNEYVEKDALVVQLTSQELKMKSLELESQVRTADEQWRSLTRQLNSRRDIPESERFEMTANLEQLQIQKTGYLEQLEVTQKQMELLAIHAPISGTVMTWDAKRRLENLPVAANQPLLTLADLDGPWQVELMIPQNRVGYIQDALQKKNGAQLTTEMILATDPNRRIPGRLVRISDRAEPTGDGQTVFRAIVEMDKTLIDHPQPGAGVTVRVECGSRAAGFVWFYQVIDFVRTQVLF